MTTIAACNYFGKWYIPGKESGFVIPLNPEMMFLEAVGVRIHNLGISIFVLLVCSRLAALLNAPLTSNDFNRQSQISSVDAGLRNG